MRTTLVATVLAILLPAVLAAGGPPDSIFADGFEVGSDCAWTLERWYVDVDGDTYGDQTDPGQPPGCPAPAELVSNSLDCDDTDPEVHPGADEICDGLDNDCDLLIDADDPDLVAPPCENQNGVCNGSVKPLDRCVEGAWQACTNVDYFNYAEFFEVVESLCDGVDNDCDGLTDETCG